ncbi:MAG: hypothetical protein ACI4U9_02740 [Clostridia bacterium]
MFEDYELIPIEKETDEGGKLVKPIAQLLCFIPDAVLETCQKMFVTTEPFKKSEEEIEKEKDELQKGEEIRYFSIKYSPGIIFSGTVPAFDVNFIKNNADEWDEKDYRDFIRKNFKEYKKNSSIKAPDWYDVQKSTVVGLEEYTKFSGEVGSSWGDWPYDYWAYYLEKDNTLYVKTVFKIYHDMDEDLWFYSTEYPITDELFETTSYTSVAARLQPTIATWYNALRKIALVGLLSVLVYIGIRIVLTSTSAKDKAKYKNMLKDWLIALCILFTLHYIMSITATIVENINEVINASVMETDGEDVMLTTLRNDIANAKNWSTVIVQVVLYFILAVYTIIFTVQYLKRTIYLAFLTVIAPLITLTYPLDKIKDSKAQAFDMWIKDYIFFMLIQVVHLLIYYILVGSSLNLANKGNWVFAIVAIGFLVPAEKIIKKMFGFEKSKTLGAMAAGATGALIMNAMSKLARKRCFKERKNIRKFKKR